MNRKILKLILASALGLSLLCAAQTANAMEDKKVSTTDDNKLNNSNVDEKSKIFKLLTTSFKLSLLDHYTNKYFDKNTTPEYDSYNNLIRNILLHLKSRIFYNPKLDEISAENRQKIEETANCIIANLIDYENFLYKHNFNLAFKIRKKANPNLSIEEFRKRSFAVFRSYWIVSRSAMVIFKIAEEFGIRPKSFTKSIRNNIREAIEKFDVRGINPVTLVDGSLDIYKDYFKNPKYRLLSKTINSYRKLSLLKIYNDIIQNCEELISNPIVSVEEFANKFKGFIEHSYLKPLTLLKNIQPKSTQHNSVDDDYNMIKRDVLETVLDSFLPKMKNEIKNKKSLTKGDFIDQIKKLFIGFGEKLEIELDEKDFEFAQNFLTKEKIIYTEQTDLNDKLNDLRDNILLNDYDFYKYYSDEYNFLDYDYHSCYKNFSHLFLEYLVFKLENEIEDTTLKQKIINWLRNNAQTIGLDNISSKEEFEKVIINLFDLIKKEFLTSKEPDPLNVNVSNQVDAQPSSNNLVADKTQSSKEADLNLNDVNKKAELKKEKTNSLDQSLSALNNAFIGGSINTSIIQNDNNSLNKTFIGNTNPLNKSASLSANELNNIKINESILAASQPQTPNEPIVLNLNDVNKKAELNKENNLVAEQKPINSQVDFKISDDQILEIIKKFEKTFAYSKWSNTNIESVVKCLINIILYQLMNCLKIDDISKLANTNFKTTREDIYSFVLNSIENSYTSIKDAFSENEFTKFRCRILAKCFEAIENIYNHKILNNNQIEFLKKMANI